MSSKDRLVANVFSILSFIFSSPDADSLIIKYHLAYILSEGLFIQLISLLLTHV
jgi:hypothetical protein